MEPTIIVPEGINNADIKKAQERLKKGGQYQDLKTVIVCPTRGVIPARVVESWMNLMKPMNNAVYGPIFVAGAEVGAAYQAAMEMILSSALSDWKYLLTIEEDNIPPADGLLKLYENICQCKKLCTEHYSAVGGLYWTKGEGTGQPMIYGNPKTMLEFTPQLPLPDKIQECNGLGMGFTLFRLDLFRDERIEQPWFKTVQSPTEGYGTQDLYFFKKVRQAGYRVASDNRTKVGHYALDEDRIY
jgi:hypothetical protein